MLSDVNKLAHGPDFWLDEVNIFDSRGLRQQFMVLRDIISVTREFLADASFKDHIQYKPCRIYTSARKTERVYGEMYSSDWYWKQMVSILRTSDNLNNNSRTCRRSLSKKGIKMPHCWG
jgi:hypothetical protein